MVKTLKPIKMVILGPKNDSFDPNVEVNSPWGGAGVAGLVFYVLWTRILSYIE
jgi:hypothetical protein